MARVVVATVAPARAAVAAPVDMLAMVAMDILQLARWPHRPAAVAVVVAAQTIPVYRHREAVAVA